MESRKQAVSIRMSAGDVRSIKKLAKRLGVRDSDLIRLAVKSMLAKLGPLNDSNVRGRSLVPVFVESGIDLFRYLEVDAVKLESIINDGAEAGSRVDEQDVQLIAMNGIQQSYAKLRLSTINGRNVVPQREAAADGNDTDSLSRSLRHYLYEKYVYASPSTPEHESVESAKQA